MISQVVEGLGIVVDVSGSVVGTADVAGALVVAGTVSFGTVVGEVVGETLPVG